MFMPGFGHTGEKFPAVHIPKRGRLSWQHMPSAVALSVFPKETGEISCDIQDVIRSGVQYGILSQNYHGIACCMFCPVGRRYDSHEVCI